MRFAFRPLFRLFATAFAAIFLLLFLVRHAAAQAAPAHPTFTVRVVGHGQPMLLIPGLTCPGAVWDDVVAHYQGQYQCHVVSLAGFGGVPAPASATTPLLPAVRDELLAYIKAQKLKRPVVLGHSLGGFLALSMAEADPSAVGPLVIVDSLPFLPGATNPAATAESVREQAAQMRQGMASNPLPLAARRQMAAGMVTDTARITQVARWGVASNPATVGEAFYDLYTTDLRPELARVQQPVLVLGTWAGYKAYGATKAGVQSVFDTQYAAVPHHTIVLSENGKHFLMYDDPQLLLGQTDAFLKQNEPIAKR